MGNVDLCLTKIVENLWSSNPLNNDFSSSIKHLSPSRWWGYSSLWTFMTFMRRNMSTGSSAMECPYFIYECQFNSIESSPRDI